MRLYHLLVHYIYAPLQQFVHLFHHITNGLKISTIPQADNSWSDYYDAIVGINELITGYFATFDQNFILCWRKKIQKIIQIHTALCEYKDEVIGAKLYIRQYMNDKKDEYVNKVYNREKLLEDIREFCRETDNFMNEGSRFVIYLDKRIAEYQKLIR